MAQNSYPITFIEWYFNGAEIAISDYQKAKHYELMEELAAAEQAHEDKYLALWHADHAEWTSYDYAERQPLERSQVCSDRITELLS